MTNFCEKHPSIIIISFLIYFWLLFSYLFRRFEINNANFIASIFVALIGVVILIIIIYKKLTKVYPKLKYSGFSIPGKKIGIKYINTSEFYSYN